MEGDTPPDFVRLLGAVEEMFAAYSAVGCMTFSLVARVLGEVTVERVKAGLYKLRRCHKKLTLAIRQNPNGRRFFAHSDKDTPLTVLDLASVTWEDAVLRELTTPFAPESGELFRVTALLGMESILILTFHHAVADGLSGVMVLRDLLLAMSGQELAPEEGHGETIEDLLGEEFTTAVAARDGAEPDLLPQPAINGRRKRTKLLLSIRTSSPGRRPLGSSLKPDGSGQPFTAFF